MVKACERAVVWRPEGGEPCESNRVPTPAERKQLEQRQRQLAIAARGCAGTDVEKRKAGAAIAEMLDGFTRSRNLDDAAKRNMVAGLVADLQALPAWAIIRACDRVRRGEAPGIDMAWLPTTPQMFSLAAAELGPLRIEERAIVATLAMVPRGGALTEEERKQRAEAADAWLSRKDPRAARMEDSKAFVGTKTTDDQQRQRRALNDRFMLQEYQKLGVEPVYSDGNLVSPALLKTIGRLPARNG